VTNPPIEEYLSAQQFFSGLNPESIKLLSGYASERQIDAGQVLFRQGERANKFYLIRSGSIAVEIPAIMGPALKVQSLGPGQVLGWSWLIPPYKWNFQASAEVKTKLLEFDGSQVLARCDADANFGYDVLKRFASLMSERLEAARQRLMEQWNPPGFA
jgi:CRP-like cAMP-binding protein